MNYALIENDKVVNIIVLAPNTVTDFPGAVSIDRLSVGIGDDYIDGEFLCGDEQTGADAEETISSLMEEVADMRAALAALGVNVDE